VKLRAGRGEECTKGFTEAGGPNRKQRALTSKCMLSEAKKPGTFSQLFQISNSYGIYIKVVGRTTNAHWS